MDNVRFENGRCYIGESCSLEAPLEAFGQVKLVNAFKEICSVHTVRELAPLLGLATVIPVLAGPNAGKEDYVPFEELQFTVISTLQRAWFSQIPGGVPRNVEENYLARFEHYQKTCERIARGETMTDTPKAKGTFGQAGPRKVYEYSLSIGKPLAERHAKLAADPATTNHVGIILAILIAQAGAPITLDRLLPACEATGRYQRKPDAKETMRQNVVYILNKLEDDGYILTHDITPAPAEKAAPAATAQEQAAKPKQEMPKAVGTKASPAPKAAQPKAAKA